MKQTKRNTVRPCALVEFSSCFLRSHLTTLNHLRVVGVNHLGKHKIIVAIERPYKYQLYTNAPHYDESE